MGCARASDVAVRGRWSALLKRCIHVCDAELADQHCCRKRLRILTELEADGRRADLHARHARLTQTAVAP
jgi:hypothetical protein